MNETLLSIRRLRAGYGRMEVLKEIALEVNRGEIVTLIGANGAGKTTALLAISGICPLWSGEVTFAGKSIAGLPAHEVVKRGVAHVPEGRQIFPRLTVCENLELGAYLRRDSAAIAKDRERVFSLFPILGERQRQLGGTLSGGEQQMLAIGRALMSRPKLLLMDEPSMGIAPMLVQRIFDTIRSLNAEGLTILLVEQNAHLALRAAHRGYVLETGSVTLTDHASALLANPLVREAYLGEEQ